MSSLFEVERSGFDLRHSTFAGRGWKIDSKTESATLAVCGL